MYTNLAPRLGQTTLTASSIGSVELRGGKINWGSLGSSISSALRNTGRYLKNAVSRFKNSQVYSDIKKGLQDSGVARNVAGLAGETLNSLVDIGRMKVENELDKLRDRVLSTIPADQLAQILQNYQQTHDKIKPQEEVLPVLAPLPPLLKSQTVTPAVEAEVIQPIEGDSRKRTMDEPASLSDAMPSSTYTAPFIPYKRRIRGTGEAEWQTQLNSMLGQGVRYTSSKHCY